jgi:uncharacterized protein (DUF1800 family)
MHRHAAILARSCLVIGLSASIGASLTADRGSSAVPARPDDRTIVHVFNRLGFGARPGDLDRVRRMGLQAYIDRQLQPARIDDHAVEARLASFETLTKSTRDLAQEYFLPGLMLRRQRQQTDGQTPGVDHNAQNTPALRTAEQRETMRAERLPLLELSEQKILRAAYSERQLEELLVDFWFSHFNVFAGKGPTRVFLTEYERDMIRPRALGKFRDLLQATAESPAMLFYLDNWQSAAPQSPTDGLSARRRLDDRRGMRGVVPRSSARTADGEMSMDAAARLQNRRPRGINENYARELMELHTLGVDGGYTQKDVQEVARAFTGWTLDNLRLGGGFRFSARLHDDGEKVVLGHRIKAGGGKEDGEHVLDILAAHPSTATFIATKLARRLVSDQPPKALIDRSAQRFRETGGDIREVVRTIVTSPEFFAVEAYRAKVKTPFEFIVSAVRATGVDAADAVSLAGAIRDLGMPLYMCQPPTGYADRADAWVNTGALLNRMNFAVALTSGRLRGVRLDPATPQDAAAAANGLVASVIAGDLSHATSDTVARATQTSQAIALLLGSPEFQRK